MFDFLECITKPSLQSKTHSNFNIFLILEFNVRWQIKIINKFTNISPRFYFKNICILHNDTNTSNLLCFKMKHLSFSRVKILDIKSPLNLSHSSTKLFFKNYLISLFITDFSISLSEILGTFVIIDP